MVRRARATKAKEVIVATEVGMLHRLKKEAPNVDFIPANAEARCGYMGMITPQKLLRTLQTGEYEVTLAPEIIEKARLPIERMIAVA